MPYDSTHSAFATLLIDPGALPSPGATGSYQSAGRIKNMKLGGIKWDPKETTALDATQAIKTFRAGRGDTGDLSFSLYYKSDDFATLLALAADRQNYNFQIQFPDGPDFASPLDQGSTLDFEALFTDIPLDIPEDDELMCEIKLKLSGPVTFTAGA